MSARQGNATNDRVASPLVPPPPGRAPIRTLTARRTIPGYRPATDPVSHLQKRAHHRPDPTASSRRGRLPEALFAADAVPAGDELALPVAAALTDQAKEAIGRAIAASRSPNTRRNYQTAWRAWEDWARGCGYQVLPARAETVAEYLTERAAAGAGVSTLGMALAAIAAAHGAAGETDPTRSEGVRRTGGQAQAGGRRRRAAAGQAAHRDGPGRDRGEHPAHGAGAHGARALPTMRDALLRRSEAAALTWADIEAAGDGSGRLTIRRAKGDQEGRGEVVYIGTAALDALEAIRPGDAGPGGSRLRFAARAGKALSESAIARAIDRAARRAGLGAGFSGTRQDRHGPRPQPGRDGHPRDPAAGRWASRDGRALHPLGERRPRRRPPPSTGRSGERACW